MAKERSILYYGRSYRRLARQCLPLVFGCASRSADPDWVIDPDHLSQTTSLSLAVLTMYLAKRDVARSRNTLSSLSSKLSLLHTNGADLRTFCTVGINFRSLWRAPGIEANPRSIASSAIRPPQTCTAREPLHPFPIQLPYDIVEMIIVHFAHDRYIRKTCSGVCRSWKATAIPDLYHTLTLAGVDRKPVAVRWNPYPTHVN